MYANKFEDFIKKYLDVSGPTWDSLESLEKCCVLLMNGQLELTKLRFTLRFCKLIKKRKKKHLSAESSLGTVARLRRSIRLLISRRYQSSGTLGLFAPQREATVKLTGAGSTCGPALPAASRLPLPPHTILPGHAEEMSACKKKEEKKQNKKRKKTELSAAQLWRPAWLWT